jgi:hypothetical protein
MKMPGMRNNMENFLHLLGSKWVLIVVLIYGLVDYTVALNSHLIVDVRSLSLSCQTNWKQFVAGSEFTAYGLCVGTTES